MRRAYDDAGRMTTKTLPSGTGVVSSYTYDNADRLTAIAVGMGMCVSGVLSTAGCAIVGFTYGFAATLELLDKADSGANPAQLAAAMGFLLWDLYAPNSSIIAALLGEGAEELLDWFLGGGLGPKDRTTPGIGEFSCYDPNQAPQVTSR